MANETYVTLVGNLTADPELRFTAEGTAVASFTIASTPRHFDKRSNEWVDDEAMFMRCTVWRTLAENVAESLQRGMQVIAYGRQRQRSYETREGEKRTVIECQVDTVGPSLQWATAKVNRTTRGSAQAGPSTNDDPWGSDYSTERPAGGETSSGSTGGGFTDEPPF